MSDEKDIRQKTEKPQAVPEVKVEQPEKEQPRSVPEPDLRPWRPSTALRY